MYKLKRIVLILKCISMKASNVFIKVLLSVALIMGTSVDSGAQFVNSLKGKLKETKAVVDKVTQNQGVVAGLSLVSGDVKFNNVFYSIFK